MCDTISSGVIPWCSYQITTSCTRTRRARKCELVRTFRVFRILYLKPHRIVVRKSSVQIPLDPLGRKEGHKPVKSHGAFNCT